MDTVEKYKKYVNTAFVKAVEPVVIESAKGATYYDTDGKTYLDCFSGISVTNAGHGNDEVISAAITQMKKLVHCCSYVYHVQPVADLAERLAEITPGKLTKSFFGSGGAEAIEGAMRLAKRYTMKNEMISLTHSFHGRSYATLSLTGNAGRKKGGGPYMPGVAFAPAPYCYRCPFKLYNSETCNMACAEYLEDVIKYQTSENVAFFIAEPVMGEGGIIVPPQKYFTTIKQILSHFGVLFIVDEVQTGFGRTGKMFAIEHYGVEPDIMVMAKGIADGFPLSCFIAPDEIADSFKVGDHLSTFGGNPVSCAASLANINYLEREKLSQASSRKGDILRSKIAKINPKGIKIGDIRGKGLMTGVELVKDTDSKMPAAQEASNIREKLRQKGIMVGLGGVHGNVIRLQPPLVITENELEVLVTSFKEIMEGTLL